MQELIIVELPSNLGLIEPGPGREPGVKKLPEWLKTNGLHELLHAENTYTLLPPAYTMEIDSESGVRNANSIISFAIRQAELLKKLLMEKKFVVALGGDCSDEASSLKASRTALRMKVFAIFIMSVWRKRL